MYNYKSYLQEVNSMSFEESTDIYEKLMAELDFHDIDIKELWDELIENSLEYATIRSKWLTLPTSEERFEKDQARTMKHNLVIISFNVLSRYLEKIGKDTSWRSQLGEDRKRIGDFVCYIAYILGLNAR